MTTALTTEQILALAPDSASVKAGKGLASQRKWVHVGQNTRALWGECQGSGSEPYRTQVDLTDFSFRCSCPSRKFPCKHTLGLLLLHAASDNIIPEATTMPPWVEEWLNKRQDKAQPKQRVEAQDKGSASGAGSKATASSARQRSERQKRIDQGLDELARWLGDLVRQGLAAVQSQPIAYWEHMAARMVDAQAPGIARMLREMAGIAASGTGWHERLLERLGLLHLLLESYRRIEVLPGPLQADVRTLVGWTLKQEDMLNEPSKFDDWLVVGQRTYEEERLQVNRTWLWGQRTEQSALILDFAHQGQPLDRSLVPGTYFEGELVYYPSAYPQRALLRQRLSASASGSSTSGYPSIESMLSAYAAALACVPWLASFPAQLANVVPVHNDTWLICDTHGQVLPISPRFERLWNLLALSGGQPIWLFGEWDGVMLLPLAVQADGRFVRL